MSNGRFSRIFSRNIDEGVVILGSFADRKKRRSVGARRSPVKPSFALRAPSAQIKTMRSPRSLRGWQKSSRSRDRLRISVGIPLLRAE
jgi:hypothetical protein